MSKKTKKESKKSESKKRVNKSFVAILSLILTSIGTFAAVVNVFLRGSGIFPSAIFKFLPYVFIILWVVGLALAFNAQKATIKWNRTVGIVSVGIMAVSFLVFLIYGQVIYSSEDYNKLNVCKYNLMRIAQVMDKYKNDHQGHYPQNIDVLLSEDYFKEYIQEIYKCPLNNNNYRIEISGWEAKNFTIWCLNEPIRHIGKSGPEEITTQLYYSSVKEDVEHVCEEKR